MQFNSGDQSVNMLTIVSQSINLSSFFYYSRKNFPSGKRDAEATSEVKTTYATQSSDFIVFFSSSQQ